MERASGVERTSGVERASGVERTSGVERASCPLQFPGGQDAHPTHIHSTPQECSLKCQSITLE
ncbi:MAG: hypothetical protein F6J90_07220 [Moorea sp. SIOASIH]|uniref:hypothetical protein n=1 Tax=Moorena sp. SIOASIH TaxID=2607817 RepID=UPI0013BB7122|nr:hypothetical protein [Moorena sp. SIOASIH]NEO36127.1 hypothetical protein [Moorena sp. SIOASIH]